MPYTTATSYTIEKKNFCDDEHKVLTISHFLDFMRHLLRYLLRYPLRKEMKIFGK